MAVADDVQALFSQSTHSRQSQNARPLHLHNTLVVFVDTEELPEPIYFSEAPHQLEHLDFGLKLVLIQAELTTHKVYFSDVSLQHAEFNSFGDEGIPVDSGLVLLQLALSHCGLALNDKLANEFVEILERSDEAIEVSRTDILVVSEGKVEYFNLAPYLLCILIGRLQRSLQ
jgi:hypothetical protein